MSDKVSRFTRFTRSGIRIVTVIIMSIAVMTATADGFAQSYSGLYHWGLEHKLSGWKADSFPLLVDLFILVGELGLFLLALDGHRVLRKSLLSWVDLLIPVMVAATGWSVSLWFNVGHVQNATVDDKVTAGVPPITAMIGLVILLRTVHRYMARMDEASSSAVTYDMSRVPVKDDSIMDETPAELPTPGAAPVDLSTPEPAQPGALPRVQAVSPVDLTTAGRQTSDYAAKHPKWDEGVRLYRESLTGPGKPLSQRDLASALEMSNRSLAAAIIRHVRQGN